MTPNATTAEDRLGTNQAVKRQARLGTGQGDCKQNRG
jgi:hypothetical protein